MKNNIYLFTGEDRFNLLLELNKWKLLFIKKYGAENFFEFKSDEFEPANIINTIISGGLFVTKKLVIVNGYPKDGADLSKISETNIKIFEEKFLQYVDQISQDTILIFVSNSPDKRTKPYKYLLSNVTIKDFSKPSKPDIVSFIKLNIKTEIDKDIIDYLIENIGYDYYSLNNEIIKLNNYIEKNGNKLTKELIDKVIFVHTNINSFDILDKIFVDKNIALAFIQDFQIKSNDGFQFLGMLQRGTKILINIIDLLESGVDSSKIVAEKLSIHPFVANKNFSLAKKMISKKSTIISFFIKLIDLEYNIKTGKIPNEIFWIEIKQLINSI